MISLDLQLFAKTSAYMKEYRKTKAISKYKDQQEIVQKEKEKEEKKERGPVRQKSGEAVTAVSRNEVYSIYAFRNGKETYVKDREGSVIMSKMYYDKDRKAWISRDKGNKYRIRKK